MKTIFILVASLMFCSTIFAQQPLFRYNVQGCAADRPVSKSRIPPSETIVTVWQDTLILRGDSLVFHRTQEHMCCRKVKLSYEIKNSLITIKEYWDGMGCKCKCSSSVDAVIQKIPAGTYLVKVLATGTDPITNKPSNKSETIVEKTITISTIPSIQTVK